MSYRTEYDNWPWNGHRDQGREDARYGHKNRELFDPYDGDHKRAYVEGFRAEERRQEEEARAQREHEEQLEEQRQRRLAEERRYAQQCEDDEHEQQMEFERQQAEELTLQEQPSEVKP